MALKKMYSQFATWVNRVLHSDVCAHYSLKWAFASLQTDKRLRRSHQETLHPCLSKLRIGKVLIRLCENTGWYDCSPRVPFLTLRFKYSALEPFYTEKVIVEYPTSGHHDQLANRHPLISFSALVSVNTKSGPISQIVNYLCIRLSHFTCSYFNLVLLNPDIPCLCKQCRPRSAGF